MTVWTWIEEIRPEGSNLEEIVWRLPFFNGHSSGPWGSIDLDSFSRASAYQALGAGLLNFWAWWWPQKMAQKSFFSQSYKRSKYRHEMALLSLFFYKMASLFWFSLFLLPLSGFWPFSFKPPLAPLGGVIKRRSRDTRPCACLLHYGCKICYKIHTLKLSTQSLC